MALVPAVAYKEEIEKYSDLMRYSQEMMFYNGCSEHGRVYIHTDPTEGNYQWAIVNDKKELVGYIAYRVDYFSGCVYSFGLLKFKDEPLVMANGIKRAIEHIISLKPHRIEFRCVSDNPAGIGYSKILKNVCKNEMRYQIFHLTDVFKDAYGSYHGCCIFEVIGRKK